MKSLQCSDLIYLIQEEKKIPQFSAQESADSYGKPFLVFGGGAKP